MFINLNKNIQQKKEYTWIWYIDKNNWLSLWCFIIFINKKNLYLWTNSYIIKWKYNFNQKINFLINSWLYKNIIIKNCELKSNIIYKLIGKIKHKNIRLIYLIDKYHKNLKDYELLATEIYLKNIKKTTK